MRQYSCWEDYALALAEVAAGNSEDPYCKVGCAVLREDYSVASLGYNGPPPKVDINWEDRDGRRPLVVHAETNALRFLKPTEGFLLACTLAPCASCMANIASYGIQRIVFRKWYDKQCPEELKKIAATFGVALRCRPKKLPKVKKSAEFLDKWGWVQKPGRRFCSYQHLYNWVGEYEPEV